MDAPKRIIVFSAAILILCFYIELYLILPDRDQGRARLAGEYFHYRDFDQDWEVYFFSPAAFVEGQMIQLNPKPFLGNPTWATTPQRLVIRVPGNTTMFWFPPRKLEKGNAE